MGELLATTGSESTAEPKGIAIPPKPSLLSDIARVYPNTEKVGALIAEHPGISDGVLKVANSPSLGLPHPVEKLEQAVVMLGLDSVMNVINAVLLQSTLDIKDDPKLIAFWKNTKATAAAAGILAIELTQVKPDDAYLLGLFRDCAIPLMYQSHPNYFRVLETGYKDMAARIITIEDKQFKANHAIVGQLIARAWGLPSPIVQAINDHHSHRRLKCASCNQIEKYIDRLCATLKLAEHVTRTSACYGKINMDYEWNIYKKDILKLIGKEPQEILDVVNATVVTIKETEDLL